MGSEVKWCLPIIAERARYTPLTPAQIRYLRKFDASGAATAGQVGIDKSTAARMVREGLLASRPHKWTGRVTTVYMITELGRSALAPEIKEGRRHGS